MQTTGQVCTHVSHQLGVDGPCWGHSTGSSCPMDEWTLCLFANVFANTIQSSSIKVYLSTVQALHVDQGFPDPLQNYLCLQLVIHGIKHSQGSPSSNCLPIIDSLILRRQCG